MKHLHLPRSRRHRKPRAPGSAPGLIHLDPEARPPELRVRGYGPDAQDGAVVTDPSELARWLSDWPVTWIDMTGLGAGPELEAVTELLGLHLLAVEDVVNVGQRAKLEAYPDQLFIVAHMAFEEDATTEQVSLFLGEGWVLTIQEQSGDCFEGVRKRIETGGGGRIRSRGADYLVYALLDTIIDSYFGPFETIGAELDELEENVLGDPTPEVAERVHRARRAIVGLRKALAPHRDAVNQLIRDDHQFVVEETRMFLRDVYDHALRLVEIGEMYRDLTGDLMGMYLTVVSHKLNEVMKVLTIIATIFMPLGFIAGLYGMNFDPEASRWNMPELGWTFGYPFALGLMAAVAGGFVWYMWRKGWL